MEEQERFFAYDNLKNLFESILPFTIQLYILDSDIQPISFRPHASGILFTANNNFYIITAAHVFHQEIHDNIGFHIKNVFYTLECDIVYTNIDSNESNNQLDMCVCKLGAQTVVDLLQEYDFLNINSIEFSHKLAAGVDYFILGYPVSKTNMNRPDNIIYPKSMPLLTHGIVDEKKYKKLKVIEEVFLVKSVLDKSLDMQKNRVFKSARPEGISGCGLWFHRDNKLYLIGIMTAWNKAEAVMFSTKIDVAIAMINKHFDNTICTNT